MLEKIADFEVEVWRHDQAETFLIIEGDSCIDVALIHASNQAFKAENGIFIKSFSFHAFDWWNAGFLLFEVIGHSADQFW
jgi:hypothetical protein